MRDIYTFSAIEFAENLSIQLLKTIPFCSDDSEGVVQS